MNGRLNIRLVFRTLLTVAAFVAVACSQDRPSRSKRAERTVDEYLRTADAFYARNENDSALKYLNKVLDMSFDSTLYYSVLVKMSWAYLQKDERQMAEVIAKCVYNHYNGLGTEGRCADYMRSIRILAVCERASGDHKSSLHYMLQVKQLCHELGDTSLYILCCCNIGNTERFLRNITSSVDYYNLALKLCDSDLKKYGNQKVEALLGLSNVYDDLSDTLTASQLLKLDKHVLDRLPDKVKYRYYIKKMRMAFNAKNFGQAEKYHGITRQLCDKIGTLSYRQNFIDNSCEYYIARCYYDSAQMCLEERKKYLNAEKNEGVLDNITIRQVEIDLGTGNYDRAEYLLIKHRYSDNLMQNTKGVIRLAALSERLYAAKGDYRRAYNANQYCRKIIDSIALESQSKLLMSRQMRYKRELSVLNNQLQIERGRRHLDRMLRQQIAFIILIVSIILAFLSWMLRRRNKMAHEREMMMVRQSKLLESEVVRQTTILNSQSDEINRQNAKILNNINYAECIQRSILPDIDHLQAFPISDFFVYFKPQSIVSGDFYWFMRKGDDLYICCADCTGHGVPGAFLSMMCCTILTNITEESVSPVRLVEELDVHLRTMLHSNVEFSMVDTIDMAVIAINCQTFEMRSCSARRPIFVYRGTECIELPMVRRSIGDSEPEFMKRDFTEHKFSLQSDDCIYMFSDGITDQFGGNSARPEKFKLKRLCQLFDDIHGMPMSSQKDMLDQRLQLWQGSEEQTDDILVIAIRI